MENLKFLTLNYVFLKHIREIRDHLEAEQTYNNTISSKLNA